MDGAFVTKFNSIDKKSETYFDGPAALGVTGCNGTKNTPSLIADLFGDWREELVVRSEKDPTTIYIIATPVTSPHRVYTLMHDATYRTAVASENTAYNQPPHLGYYLPDMVKSLKQPDVYVVGESVEVPVDTTPVVNDGESILDASKPKEGAGWTEKDNEGYLKNGYYNFENTLASYAIWEIFSQKEAKTTLTIRFANGGTSGRNMALTMNGKSVGTVSFPATGWTTYKEANIDVTLKAGVNTLKLSSMTSDGGPNIDLFTFGIDDVELYDGTQKTTIAASQTFMPNVYNPVTGILRTREAGLAEIYAFDVTGKLVGGISRNVTAGTSKVMFDREMLPRGAYMMVVKLNGRVISKSLRKAAK